MELALNDCTIIEWPEIVEDILPNDRINLTLEERSKDIIEVTLSSKKYNSVMKNLDTQNIKKILKTKKYKIPKYIFFSRGCLRQKIL